MIQGLATAQTTAKDLKELWLSEAADESAARFDRWTPLLLILILLLGAAIRLRQFFACPSYWYDEAYLLLNIYEKPCRELFGPLRSEQVTAPLFLCLLRGFYSTFGGAEWVMRLPATLASLAALILMFFLARRALGSRGALLAVALCAFSHHAMAHGNEVHPYSTDFLFTEVILFVGMLLVSPSATDGMRNRSRAVLLVLACFAPWASFTSALVLGAASLALLLDARARGGRTAWAYWMLFNSLLLVSGWSLWWFHARHLYSSGLRDFWIECGGFPKDYSLATLLKWSVGCFVGIGDYGTTSLGIPLLLLALIGAVRCGKKSLPLAVLFIAPILLGWLLALLGRYPMADRTVFYAVPCVWLLAILGVEGVCRRAGAQRVPVGVFLTVVLLTPGAVRASKYLVLIGTKSDFRGAFVHVDRHRRERDLCWVSHPEVFEVYYRGARTCMGSYTPAPQVAEGVRGNRLWVISPPQSGWNDTDSPALADFLRSLGLQLADREQFTGLEVLLFEPIAQVADETERDPLTRPIVKR